LLRREVRRLGLHEGGLRLARCIGRLSHRLCEPSHRLLLLLLLLSGWAASRSMSHVVLEAYRLSGAHGLDDRLWLNRSRNLGHLRLRL
jgi:hypothetical protein